MAHLVLAAAAVSLAALASASLAFASMSTSLQQHNTLKKSAACSVWAMTVCQRGQAYVGVEAFTSTDHGSERLELTDCIPLTFSTNHLATFSANCSAVAGPLSWTNADYRWNSLRL